MNKDVNMPGVPVDASFSIRILLRMATNIRGQSRLTSHKKRSMPYSLPSRRCEGLEKDVHWKSKMALEKKDWKDATCSVCMEYPHNAVLLLCSSHSKGCRPYMCGTSYRYSNCLDQYKKAYTKAISANNSILSSSKSGEVMELACPLCRGQVKGMTVVEPARNYLNAKKRNCTQDSCSFIGKYKQLRKHVREEHPFASPHEVDPTVVQKWKTLESEREREDVLSTIRSSMPGAMVMGDYVIERSRYHNHYEDYGGFDDRGLLNFFHALDDLSGLGGGGVSLNDRRARMRMQRALGRVRSRIGDDFESDEEVLLGGRGRDRAMTAHRRLVRRRRRRSEQSSSVADVT
ncbi:hypothetical protein GIB67_025887 [Kingdonia uniflora]|uniref:Uncharacterized protein n=1 Tax=Kingdonia uniflora TaxID=39325 RepID=A0A7J7LXR6_9MAGN|nr:hypothetical protein GIB67_025887 [Kingdonia uniflora]